MTARLSALETRKLKHQNASQVKWWMRKPQKKALAPGVSRAWGTRLASFAVMKLRRYSVPKRQVSPSIYRHYDTRVQRISQ